MGSQEIEDALIAKAHEKYDQKETMIGATAMRYHERMLMLQIVDSQWKDHLLAMDHLKEGISLRGYGQRDPLVEYKKESYDLFEALMSRIEEDTLRFLFLLQPVEEQPVEETVDPEAVAAAARIAFLEEVGARRIVHLLEVLFRMGAI